MATGGGANPASVAAASGPFTTAEVEGSVAASGSAAAHHTHTHGHSHRAKITEVRAARPAPPSNAAASASASSGGKPSAAPAGGGDDSDSEIDPGSDGENELKGAAVYANSAAALQSASAASGAVAKPAPNTAPGGAPTNSAASNVSATAGGSADGDGSGGGSGSGSGGGEGSAAAAAGGGGGGGGGEDESGEGGGGEGEESDEEDDEPKLKYQRLGSSVGGILAGTNAKCLAAHEKFLVLGTSSGTIHMLDLNGNEIMKLHPHTAAINDMSLDSGGDFLASGSDDGTVVITNLYSREQTRHNYYAPIKAVAMPANYTAENKFASGGAQRQFIINTKGWFSTKDNVIHAGEGPIHAIRWRTSLIAWANNLGVKIFDSSTNEKITYIARGSGVAGTGGTPEVLPPADQYRCNLCWAEDNALLIGWGNSVKIGLVKTKSGLTATTGATRYVQIVALFTTDFFISGIAPFKEYLVLLAYSEDENTTDNDSNTTGGAASDAPRLTGPSASTDTKLSAAGTDSAAAGGGAASDTKSTDSKQPKRPVPPSAAGGAAATAVTKPPPPNTPAPGTPGGAASAASANSKPAPPPAAPAKPVRGQRPELRIISWTNTDISSDALPIHGFQTYRATDYRLEYLRSNSSGVVDSKSAESLFYIVSPKDIVVARSRDVDDHITWLLQRSRFEDALIAAQQNRNSLRVHKLLDVGEQFLKFLLSRGEYERAARMCPELLMGHAELWETWIEVFAKAGRLKVITAYIPTQNPKLSEEMYEMVLQFYINEDSDGLLRTIKEWAPLRLYHIDTIITAVSDKLKQLAAGGGGGGGDAVAAAAGVDQKQQSPNQQNDRTLTESLAELYILNKQYHLALLEYLKLGRKELVFDFIVKYELFDSVKDKVLSLMNFDKPKALDLLVGNSERIPVAAVVKQLESAEELQNDYLHALFTRGNPAGEKYHELQVRLYARYDRAHLLTFLRNSNSYILEEAFDICQSLNYYPEMVFLLERMGEYRAALSFIIDKLADVRAAIAFVEEHKDDQLWEELITRSLVSPDFLSNLLEHVGSHYVDLKKLIARIPDDLPIPDLKHKLVSIMSDCQLQVNVRRGCNNILKGDVINLSNRLNAVRRAGVKVSVDRDVRCGLCGDSGVFVGKIEPVVCFFCNHTYHASCIEGQRVDRKTAPQCIRCNARNGGGGGGMAGHVHSGNGRPALLAAAAAAPNKQSSKAGSGGSGSGGGARAGSGGGGAPSVKPRTTAGAAAAAAIKSSAGSLMASTPKSTLAKSSADSKSGGTANSSTALAMSSAVSGSGATPKPNRQNSGQFDMAEFTSSRAKATDSKSKK